MDRPLGHNSHPTHLYLVRQQRLPRILRVSFYVYSTSYSIASFRKMQQRYTFLFNPQRMFIAFSSILQLSGMILSYRHKTHPERIPKASRRKTAPIVSSINRNSIVVCKSHKNIKRQHPPSRWTLPQT